MASPMQRVSTSLSKDIGDYLTNRKAWGPVMYNVLEHGLKGDGKSDDTAALQKLIDTAIQEGRKAIFFPHTSTGGEYFVTSLTNANQVMFFGDNSKFVGGYTGAIRQLGDLATSEQLADMSQELEDKADKTEVNALATSKANQSDLLITNSNVALKADKSYVDTQVAAVASGSPKGTYATLSALQSAFPSGNSNIYLVTADGQWYYWSGSAWSAGGAYQSTGFATGSVAPQFTSFLENISLNLFNKDAAVAGYAVSISDGALVSNAGYHASEFMPVEGGQTYISVQQTNRAWYDSSKVFISGANQRVTAMPSNARFMRISVPNASLNTEMFAKGVLPETYVSYYSLFKINGEIIKMEAQSKWTNKIWNVLGDSMTFGANTSITYHEYIKTDKGIAAVNNYGISGSKITYKSDRSDEMSTRYATMTDNADLITVLGGVNDAGNVPLGVNTDNTNDTFYGALDTLYKGLINKYPAKTIAVFTPLQFADRDSDMIPFVNAIKEVAGRYSIPCLDLFNAGGLSPKVPIITSTYFDPQGLHPNTAAHRIMADKIGSFLETL